MNTFTKGGKCMSSGGEKGIFEHLQSNKLLKPLLKIWAFAMDPTGSLVKYLIDNFLQMYFPKLKGYVDDFIKTAKEIEKASGRIKKLVKIIKTIFKGFKCLLKCAKVIFDFIVQLFFNFASPICWITWGITILLIITVFFSTIFGKFGSFKGELTIDLDKMQEMNQDEEAYTDLLNTAALREAFYDSISDTSFYQTFNLTDMGDSSIDTVATITSQVVNAISASSKIINENIDTTIYNQGNILAKLSHSGINAQQYDPRYAITDANMNPVKYLIQAESLGTYSDQFGTTSYFRDYWGREESYTLSSTLLYELNRWLYENDLKSANEQIVYPEAFTQPVSYVKDYLRINTDKVSTTFGKPYVYVTQRVTLDDIRNSRSEYFNQYQLEGLIKTSPSNLIYDYAIVNVNDTDISFNDKTQTGTAAKYATIKTTINYSDGTIDTTEELMRLYWIVHPDYMDLHMSDYQEPGDLEADVASGYYLGNQEILLSDAFTGPFYGIYTDNGKIKFEGVISDSAHETTENNYVYIDYTCYIPGSSNASGAIAVFNSNITKISKVIDFNKSLGLGGTIPANSYFYYNGNGYQNGRSGLRIEEGAVETALNNGTIIPVDIVTYINNQSPRKHYQLAPLTDESGEIQVSSRNLINKTYIEKKAVRSVYRNSDEYWEGFAEFIEMDLEKAGYVGTITDVITDSIKGECYPDSELGLYYLDYSGEKIEEPDDWASKKCSVIKYYNQDSLASDFVADIKNWVAGESATMEIESESIYYILLAYEDYLIQTGVEGDQWEYRYYTNSQADTNVNEIIFDDSKIKLSQLISGNAILAIFNAYKDSVGTEQERYKDTFDAVVKLNESRAISSEYTPVAVVTGTQGYSNQYDSTITGDTWGWKAVKVGSEYKLKRVYGEASLEFPEYYSENDQRATQVLDTLKNIMDETIANTLDMNSTQITSALNGLVGYFFGTGYAQNIYGNVNFSYKWIKNADGTYDLEYDEEALKNTLTVAFLKMDNLDIEYTDDMNLSDFDIRNYDEAWNQNVEIWRPKHTNSNETIMESCKISDVNQCGRITSQNSYDDYLAMELKSVRDYGLGSVLSYIDEYKVVFKTGLAISEMYDASGAKKWFERYYSTVCNMSGSDLTKQVNASIKGFYPSALLDYELDGLGKLSDYIKSKNSNNDYNNGDVTIENFTSIQIKDIADGLNELQGTGKSIYKYKANGYTYQFTVTYATDLENPNSNENYGYIVMVKDPTDNTWKRTSINVVIPYISNKWLSDALRADESYTDEDAMKESTNQFFNPEGYYISWYDRTDQDSQLEEIVLKVLNKNIVSTYDNKVATSLRNIIQNNPNDAGEEIEGLSTLANKQGFKGAGVYSTSSIWARFYNDVQESINDIDLINEEKTTNVFLIEEAVTFLGNFMYTYDTELIISGDMYGNEKIVSDIIFSDRYYVISNYIFALPVYSSPVEWGSQRTLSGSIEVETDDIDEVMSDTYVLNTIARNNPCFDYNQSDIEDSISDNIFSKFFSWIKGDIGSESKTEKGYCTSNYSYDLRTEEEVEEVSTRYYEIVVDSVTVQTEQKYCYARDGVQGRTTMRKYQSITDVDCEKVVETITNEDGSTTTKTTYTKTTTKYKSGDYVYTDYDYYYYYYYYLDYDWHYKLGYTLKPVEANADKMIYIDTYDEVVRIYDYLLGKNNSDANESTKNTAAKLFVGMKIYNNLDGIGTTNKLDLIDGSYHDYTIIEDDKYIDRSNTIDEDMYDWCVKDEGGTKCVSASYGDSDWHYLTYNAVNETSTVFGRFLNSVLDGKNRFNSMFENLRVRNGFLIGEDRYDNSLIVNVNTKETWFRNRFGELYLDEHGNMDDTNMDVDSDYVSMSEFSLNQEDLKNITKAIYAVYGPDYTNETDVIFGEHEDVEPVTLTKDSNYSWQTTLYGTPIFGDNAYNKDIEIVSGNTCEVYYWWTGDSQASNGYTNEAMSNSGYSKSSYAYSTKIRTKYELAGSFDGDYNLLFVGVDVGNRGDFGTPIPLYTYLYGNEKQIAPVETGMYFNEEEYSSWIDRVDTDESYSDAKTKYILDYRKATSSYLYDYLCNFEAYIPLGVMSDDDLTYRGGDVYNAINSNINRNFEYTSSYTSVIERYLSTPEWENLINNYNYTSSEVSGFRDLFNKIIPSSIDKPIDKTTLVQYLAGMIETIFKYAPKWTIEYYNSTLTGIQIERTSENYTAITNKLYESITSTGVSDTNCKKVTLRMEDGTYREFDMLYLGFAGIYSTYTGTDAVNEVVINTKNTAADSLGFEDVQLQINVGNDERLDVEKSIEFLTVKFGKLLTKYCNISSATMAYLYGEAYWDSMLDVAKTEGISTGPEWHNDEIDLIVSAMNQTKAMEESNITRYSDTIRAYGYDEEVAASVLTAEVVDYALGFITDSNERLELLRSNTSTAGDLVELIGSKADETKEILERFEKGSIDVVTANDDLLTTIDLSNIRDLSNQYDVDLGVFMSIIMATSEGNPMSGLANVTWDEDENEYVVEKITLNSLQYHKVGLFGIENPELSSDETLIEVFSRDFHTNKTVCSTKFKGDYISNTGVCTVNDYSEINIYSLTMADPSWEINGGVSIYNLKKNNNKNKIVVSNLKDFFDIDGRFANNGQDALKHALIRLSNIYNGEDQRDEAGNMIGREAIEAIYIYFNSVEALNELKTEANDRGYGSDWYGYYRKSKASGSGNDLVLKTLMYYDATMQENNFVEESDKWSNEGSDVDLTGQEIYRTIIDQITGRQTKERVIYGKCIINNGGTNQTNELITETVSNYMSSNIVSSKILFDGYLQSAGKTNASIESMKFEATDPDATIKYSFVYTNVSNIEANQIASNYISQIRRNMSSGKIDIDNDDLDLIEESFNNSIRNAKKSSYWYQIAQFDVTAAVKEYGRDVVERSINVAMYASNLNAYNKTNYFTTQQIQNFGYDPVFVQVGNSYYANVKLTSKEMHPASFAIPLITNSGNTNGEIVLDGKCTYGSPIKVILIDKIEFAFTVKDNGVIAESSKPYFIANFKVIRSPKIIDYSIKPYEVTGADTKASMSNNTTCTNVVWNGECVYTYSYYGTSQNIDAPYTCEVKRVRTIDLSTIWEVTVNGMSASAISLFDKSSGYNEYKSDVLSSMYSGIYVYTKNSTMNDEAVDLFFNSIYATEDDFSITGEDFSLFAFFNNYDEYIMPERIWIDIWDGTLVEGSRTTNDYLKYEFWDLPVVSTELCDRQIVENAKSNIVEHYGVSRDIINGGSITNNGVTLTAKRGSNIYSAVDGTVTAVGYNPIYGNYVEITADSDQYYNDIISTVSGERYKVTGMKLIYGYLLNETQSNVEVSLGDVIYDGESIGKAGNTGKTYGNQVYIALYLKIDVLDKEDNTSYNTGWVTFDPEPYITAKQQ